MLNPVPGTTRARNCAFYPGDSGCDIACPVGSPVVAAVSGRIVYSERGHTTWTTPPDTPNSVLIKNDEPIVVDGVAYPFTWYTHLSSLAYQVPDGSNGPHVAAGAVLGKSGLGNRNAHLHFGVIRIRAQASEADWLAPAKVADLVWPTAPARPALRVTLASSGQGDPGSVVHCHPAIEDGVTRVDLRPLCDALAAEVELHLDDGVIVLHPKQ